MILLGISLLVVGLWVGLHQRERAHKRSRTLGITAHPSYRQELISRMVDDVLKTVAALLAVSGLTILALVFEPLLAVVICVALFGLVLLAALWT